MKDNGGNLVPIVIGHMEDAVAFSFRWQHVGGQLEVDLPLRGQDGQGGQKLVSSQPH